MKYQILLSLKSNEKIFKTVVCCVVCCSHDWWLKHKQKTHISDPQTSKKFAKGENLCSVREVNER